MAPPSLAALVSQMCTATQFDEPVYAEWCGAIREEPRRHRKQWEFCYILEALRSLDCLTPGKRGIGFGVGSEPLPAVFASLGCQIVATDQDEEAAWQQGWVDTNQHTASIEALNDRQICEMEAFKQAVSTRVVDMRDIPADLQGFDFTWSSCALEHLGNIPNGLDFIENSLNTLNIGGYAVHTTELNISSETETLTEGGTVLYRRSDVLDFAARMRDAGHWVAPLNLDPGVEELDRYVDLPPYQPDNHVKLLIERFVTTSFGIIVRRGK